MSHLKWQSFLISFRSFIEERCVRIIPVWFQNVFLRLLYTKRDIRVHETCLTEDRRRIEHQREQILEIVRQIQLIVNRCRKHATAQHRWSFQKNQK